jgi:WD40 repeat protein
MIGEKDNTVRLWEVSKGREIHEFTGHTAAVTAVAFDPKGQFVISGSLDNTIRTWDIQSGKEFKNLASPIAPIEMMAVDSDKNVVYFVKGSVYGVRRYELHKIDLISQKTLFKTSFSRPITGIAFDNISNELVVSGGSIVVLNADNGEILQNMSNSEDFVDHMIYSGATSRAVLAIHIARELHTIDIWDTDKEKLIKSIEFKSAEIHSLGMHPTGEYFAVGTSKKMIEIRSTFNGKLIKSLEGHIDTVSAVCFSPDGKFLYSADKRSNLIQWGTDKWNYIGTFDSRIDDPTIIDVNTTGDYLLVSNRESGQVWNTISSKPIQWYSDADARRNANKINDIIFYDSSKMFLVAKNDGTVSFINFDATKEIDCWYAGYDGDFVITTKDGNYMASKGALDQIHFVDDMKVYTFDQYDLRYNRPDMIIEQLGLANKGLTDAYHKAWKKRLSKMGLDPSDFETDKAVSVPEVSLVDQIDLFEDTDNPNYKFFINAKDAQFNLERLFVDINGVPDYGLKGLDLKVENTRNLNKEIKLQLSAGLNVVEVSVLNEKGVESLSERFEVTYKPVAAKKPELHVIAIGVSNFMESDYDLTYADKDARDLVDLMRNASGYSNVNLHTLTNEMATAGNVLNLRAELELTDVDDEVIVFIASHGLLDDELDYYIAMHDTDFENPRVRGLRFDQLEALIDGIPARKKLMLIDACHSGEVDKEESALISASASNSESVKSRGFKSIKTNGSGIGLESSFELMKQLFADLRRNNGAVVISSASGEEFAFESSEWQNGVFTYSLLEGIKSGKTDLNQDGVTRVSELRDYVGKRVVELTNGMQNPTSRTENLESDFRVW